jgi:XTP/dITP diphosphohydrolase
MELVVATKNKKKLLEIKEIWKRLKVKLFSLEGYSDTPVIIENGKSFKENAAIKAKRIARFTGKPAIGEDSGICIDVLGGKPGIYSARFAGRSKNDFKNNAKVLRLMQGLPAGKRKAHYVCAVALADKSGLIGVVEGRCFGRIAFAPAGSRGFGYDPVFIPRGYKLTFAELGENLKHKISHRFRALKKAEDIVQKYIERSRRNRYN